MASEAQREQLAEALTGAFERHDMAGMGHADAGVSVTLADDDTASGYAAKLVDAAERRERLEYLAMAALLARPGNLPLQRLALAAFAALYGKKTPVRAARVGGL